MGLKLLALELEPLILYTGTTSAVLQSSGTTPISRDKLNINVRMGAISWCSSFENFRGNFIWA